MSVYNDTHKNYTKKYNNEKYDTLICRVKKGEKEIIKNYADKNGISVNALIYNFLKSKIPELNQE